MQFNNKNILTSITNLENLLNPTQINLLDSSEKKSSKENFIFKFIMQFI